MRANKKAYLDMSKEELRRRLETFLAQATTLNAEWLLVGLRDHIDLTYHGTVNRKERTHLVI